MADALDLRHRLPLTGRPPGRAGAGLPGPPDRHRHPAPHRGAGRLGGCRSRRRWGRCRGAAQTLLEPLSTGRPGGRRRGRRSGAGTVRPARPQPRPRAVTDHRPGYRRRRGLGRAIIARIAEILASRATSIPSRSAGPKPSASSPNPPKRSASSPPPARPPDRPHQPEPDPAEEPGQAGGRQAERARAEEADDPRSSPTTSPKKPPTRASSLPLQGLGHRWSGPRQAGPHRSLVIGPPPFDPERAQPRAVIYVHLSEQASAPAQEWPGSKTTDPSWPAAPHRARRGPRSAETSHRPNQRTRPGRRLRDPGPTANTSGSANPSTCSPTPPAVAAAPTSTTPSPTSPQPGRPARQTGRETRTPRPLPPPDQNPRRWNVRQPEPGTWIWRSPHGRIYLVNPPAPTPSATAPTPSGSGMPPGPPQELAS